ncbi:MAG: hypothetical protein WC389_17285, partial [Lutibacter sp.]
MKRQTTKEKGYVRKSRSAQIWFQYKKNKGAMIGLFLISIIVLIAIVSNFVFDFDTDVVGINSSIRLTKPNWEYLFGTDQMGRNMLARICYGAKYSLIIGVGGTLISLCVGSLIGAA